MALRASDHVFFRELFEKAYVGCMFVFTEVHPRAWPDFYRLIEARCPYMHIRFRKSGRRMLLRKMRCMVIDSILDNVRAMNICERDQELVHKFEELSQLHEKNMMSGHQRQVPK